MSRRLLRFYYTPGRLVCQRKTALRRFLHQNHTNKSPLNPLLRRGLKHGNKRKRTLRLHLWEPTDQVLRTEFNENWQKIDTAAAGLREDLTQGLEEISAANCLVKLGGPLSTRCKTARSP